MEYPIPNLDPQLEILADGTEKPAKFKDGHDEFVKVRKLGIKDLIAYAQVLGNEPRELAFICGKTEEWVHTLDIDSFTDLMEEGRRLNFRAAAASLKRNLALVEVLGSGGQVQKLVDSAVIKAMEKLSL